MNDKLLRGALLPAMLVTWAAILHAAGVTVPAPDPPVIYFALGKVETALPEKGVLSLRSPHPYTCMIRPKHFPEACPFSDAGMVELKNWGAAVLRSQRHLRPCQYPAESVEIQNALNFRLLAKP